MTWKVYNLGWDSVPFGNTDNVFVFWKRYAHDKRTRGSKGSSSTTAARAAAAGLVAHPELRARLGRAPAGGRLRRDGHPGGADHRGAGVAAWESSAFLLTYDEHGGYFDHVAPPQLDAFGLGIRVPMWVISPYAKTGPIATGLPSELSSTLKLLERLHGLPTLASQNHPFDAGTPTGGNYERTGRRRRRATGARTSATCSTASTSRPSAT